MGRRPKITSLIPLSPIGYRGDLTKEEQNCLAWHVLSGCKPIEAYITFVHPDLSTSVSIATRLQRELFGSKSAITFMAAYSDLIKEMASPQPQPSANNDNAAETTRTPPERKADEDEAEYKERCKREAAETIIGKIIDRVEDVDSLEDLLNTIRAMEKTGFFSDEMNAEKPPLRYLPETCSACVYKVFIDEQIALGNVEKVE